MQKFLFILIAGLIVFLVDLYVFQAVRTITQQLNSGLQRTILWLYWGWFLLTFCTIALATINRGSPPSPYKNYLTSILFIIFISKVIVVFFLLIDDTVRLFKYVASSWAHEHKTQNSELPKISRNEFLNKAALISGAIPLATLVYGMVRGAFNYQVKKVVLKFPNLPENFHGFRMLQISDLHTGSFTSTAPLQKAVSLINKQNADVVFFTGDLVNNIATEVEPYMHVLSEIKSKMGTFSILGNHDYGDYVPWNSRLEKLENLERLKHSHARMGWRLLLNEHVKLERNNESIAILGIENWGAKAGFPKYGKMYKAYAGAENYPFKVLLSHDPSHWDGEVLEKYPDIDLMLSGHTHGMQFGVNLPGFKWSPVQYVYKQWAGLYKKGIQHLYVNVGLGFIGYPGRVGFLPEITVFELRKA